MRHKLTVADDVLHIPHKTEYEEDYRFYALLAAVPIIALGKTI
nr:hypothetical protein [Zobellia galactanivorans]